MLLVGHPAEGIERVSRFANLGCAGQIAIARDCGFLAASGIDKIVTERRAIAGELARVEPIQHVIDRCLNAALVVNHACAIAGGIIGEGHRQAERLGDRLDSIQDIVGKIVGAIAIGRGQQVAGGIVSKGLGVLQNARRVVPGLARLPIERIVNKRPALPKPIRGGSQPRRGIISECRRMIERIRLGNRSIQDIVRPSRAVADRIDQGRAITGGIIDVGGAAVEGVDAGDLAVQGIINQRGAMIEGTATGPDTFPLTFSALTLRLSGTKPPAVVWVYSDALAIASISRFAVSMSRSVSAKSTR